VNKNEPRGINELLGRFRLGTATVGGIFGHLRVGLGLELIGGVTLWNPRALLQGDRSTGLISRCAQPYDTKYGRRR